MCDLQLELGLPLTCWIQVASLRSLLRVAVRVLTRPPRYDVDNTEAAEQLT